eukprot:TRINITY_DN75991_c0_g1_i1.p1 TRINITY_DN75991_c0_g1~~TRINITY_DN75991_c0_g1_i1.p1  ORF type:complete len:285 (-),score=51.56 TRINITY_DN75991_c0_g1_i1:8-808(-)
MPAFCPSHPCSFPEGGVPAQATVREMQLPIPRRSNKPSIVQATMQGNTKEGGLEGQGQRGGKGEGWIHEINVPAVKAHYKATELCKFHLAGACLRGTACNFAHDVSEIRAKPNFAKTWMCAKFSKKRRCDEGGNCSFAHSKKELQRAASELNKLAKRLIAKPAKSAKSAEQLGHAPALQSSKQAATVFGFKEAGAAELKFDSHRSSTTTHSPENSIGERSGTTTCSERSSSPSACYYEEPQGDMGSILLELEPYTNQLVPGKVYRL